MTNVVSFPGLGLEFTLNSTAFSVFGRDIKWYAIIILTGMILAVLFAWWEGKRTGVSPDTLMDIVIICIPVGIICARLYYVIFQWESYDTVWDMFKIWEGGLAIYGGIIGGTLSAFIYCKIKKIKIGELFDLGGFGFLIGQTLGRWGNFMNVEAYGGETDLPWRMCIHDSGICVHPTFLYESLWNVLGFVLLFLYRKHKKFSGEIFLLYVVWYGIGRAMIEGLRTDSLYLFGTGIRVSQLLACVAAITGIAVIVYVRCRIKKSRNVE